MPPSKESYLEVPGVQDEEVETLVGDLRDVFDDVCERIRIKGPQFSSGIQTFCSHYNGMLSKTYPTLSLVSAFHRFNWTVASYKRLRVMGSNRSGRQIHVQPMAAGRRRKSASRDNHAELSGRPVKMKRVRDKKNDPSEASCYVKEEPE